MTKLTLEKMSILSLLALMAFLMITSELWAAGNFSVPQAEQSITVREIKEHVKVLASDTFEGREAGSRGGTAVGVYLGEKFREYKLAGGASEKSYYQPFQGNCRNILGMLIGSDPELRDEVIIVSAHYDHVGYGNSGNSRGAPGYIHNGADDNASGTAGLIEIAQAFCNLNSAPKRTILFALWDAEEKGLWGSKHWIASPTIDRERIKLMINADMIGRLRKQTLICYGARTCQGLRRLVCEQNGQSDIHLDFTWEMPDNSDHWPFVQQRTPVLMFHTGLHVDYHTPNDDLDKLNYDGIQQITRLIFQVAWETANRPNIGSFRTASQSETIAQQKLVEQKLARKPGRLGVRWSEKTDGKPGLLIEKIHPGSAAARSPLLVGDRILRIAGNPITDAESLRSAVFAAKSPAEFVVARGTAGEEKTFQVTLSGIPIRLGIGWRVDDAEPGCLIINRIADGSPAALAGLQVNDRIYKVNEQEIADVTDLRKLIFNGTKSVNLTIERQGQIHTLEVHLPQTRK